MTQTITALVLQKRHKERVNLFLDGDYAFSLDLNLALGLKRGQCLKQAEIADLQHQDEILRAYHHALRLLGYRQRSQLEIKRRLLRQGYATAAVEVALQRLSEKRFVDDDAFARYWLEHRQRNRPRGARAIGYELRQKGVDKEIIEQVLEGVDEEASAWNAIEGKLSRWRGLDEQMFRKRAMGFLQRRGFRYDVMRGVCQRAWNALLQSPEG